MTPSNARKNAGSNRYIERRNAAANNESVTRTAEQIVRPPRRGRHRRRHIIGLNLQH
jgi:hypothetical protein